MRLIFDLLYTMPDYPALAGHEIELFYKLSLFM